jgi:ABC-type uncharacterized transport system YnjBCD ATPase subunit
MAVQMDAEVRCITVVPADGSPISIPLDCGGSYRLVSRHASEIDALIDGLSATAGVAILSQDGGLLGRMTVAENLSLALGYGRTADEWSHTEYEADLRFALQLCGVDEERLGTFGLEKPIAMNTADRWMVGLVRNILLPPELLVIDRAYSGLSRAQANAVLGIEAVFRKFHPFRPVLWLDVDNHVSHASGLNHREPEEATCLS